MDTRRYHLSKQGQVRPVEPLAFDLLAYLINNRDRVVTREELLNSLWKGKIVSDSALGARLRDARRAVEDSGDRQSVIRTVHGRGYQFVAEVVAEEDDNAREGDASPGAKREITLEEQSPVRFVRSRDGVNIAHAAVGSGSPLIISGSWMTHLEEDWKNPGWGHYVSHLARRFRLIRYDQRGNGMSDWDNVDITFEKMVDDLEAVIDAYDYPRVAIFGPSQAASVSIAYATRHPDRVTHLVLNGGYSRGRCRRGDDAQVAESQALVTLIRQSWGNDNPAIRQTYTTLMMPDASRQDADWFNAFQKVCGPAENIARFRQTFDDMDVVDLLPGIAIPTLVVHSVGDSVAPISEGRLLAARIPGASFITLNSRNHLLLENEKEFPRLIRSVCEFLNSQQDENV